MSYTTPTDPSRQRATPPSPTATTGRLPRALRRAIDPRLVIGIVIVVASILGTIALVAGSDRTVAVYSVHESLGRGQSLTADALVESEVAVGSLIDGYVRVGSLPRGGLIVTRSLAAGELLPASAIEPESSLREAALVLPITGPVADGIVPGAAVQIWALPRSVGGGETASMLADGAEVRRIRESEGFMSSGADVAVELLVSREAVPALLKAQGAGASFALVSLDDTFALRGSDAATSASASPTSTPAGGSTPEPTP
ncbi:hypothetical protein HQQ80_14075 [Microbacteriaceae bacterium VKM Ac-2855]|nr:hypothetical protein [Microbacteriaceae bacterium VKM Ac-2855]